LLAQGFLIAAVAIGAFAAGHSIGGGTANSTVKPALDQRLAGGVGIEGSITDWTPRGAQPDVGAMVLLLPTGGRVDDANRPDGAKLAPGGDEAGTKAARDALEAAGCIIVETDAAGAFHEAIPVAGEYDLLIVSRQLARNADAPGLTDFDRAVLARFVNNPAGLVGNQCFRRTTMSLRSGSRIEHEFRQ
jgi:hypothetical protein